MPETNRPETTIDDADGAPTSECVSLVPAVASAQWAQVPNHVLSRSDTGFVTHLIATAQYLPQTRSLRRATPEDAQTAYGARQNERPGVGIKTKQSI